ncbi:MAG: hypothetical protein JNJ57_10005, partial [Saprospiraceae bacterium]|nr:hypothetical protein [Saprospiraceae bacterium]
QSSCVYCDFDGYMGINNGTPSGGNIVCGQISLHNDQWFGFIPQTSSVTIDIISSNCTQGNGLQSAFFDDCSDADALICNPGCDGCGDQTFSLTYSDFTPGQTYWLMIDGWTGDVCNFEIAVTDGSIVPPAPDPTLQPQGPTQVCPGATAIYTIPESFGAGYYHWTSPAGSSINGLNNNVNINAPEGTTVTITFGSQGGNVCVQSANSCNPPTPFACLPVANVAIPPTVKPAIVLCNEDLPFTWDEEPGPTIFAPGTYNLTSTPYDSYLGCDSLVKQTVTVKPLLSSNIGTKYVCAGECFQFANDSYCDPGPQAVVIDSYQGCDSVVNFAIAVLTPNAEISGNAPITCNTPGGLTLSAQNYQGGSSFQWTNTNWSILGGAPTLNVNSTGTYHLVVTVQGGGVVCRDTTEVTVTGNTVPPGAAATNTNINCISTTASLTGSSQTSGVSFLWTGPGITALNQFLPNPVVNQPGPYVLTVTNPVNGCTSTAAVTVLADNTPPAATAVGGLITCVATNVTIDGGSNIPSPGWNWAGPGINASNQHVEDPNVTVAGTYTVTVTNSVNGCSNTATTSVSVNNNIPTASAGANDTLTCTQPNLTLQGAGSTAPDPMIVSWVGSNGFTSNSLTPSINQAGQYILTISNQLNGCVKHDTVDIAINQVLPNVSAGADSTITCAQPSVSLIGSGSSSGPNFTALWSGPGINSGNQNQYNPVVDQQGNYTLLITNTANGCTATDVVVVDNNTAQPTANAGIDQTLTCTSTNGVTLNGSGTPAIITYLWSGPGIGANNETLPNPTVTQPGTYTLTVTDPVNGCTQTDQAIISQDANVPVASGGPDMILNCTVNTVDFNGSGSSTGADITYNWSGPGISGSNITAQSPSGITLPGTYNLTVTNTINSCSNTDVVVVILDNQLPTANAGADLVLNCFNNAIDTLIGSGSSSGSIYTYLWSGPGITQGSNDQDQNPVINNQPGTYNLTVTNTDNTCTATDQVTVVADLTAPTANAGTDPTIDCVNTFTIIGGASSTGNNFEYSWTGPGITPANETILTPSVSEPGTYVLTVTNTVNGCTASSNVTVNTNAVYPAAVAGPDGLITCAQTSFTFNTAGTDSGAGFNLIWTGPGINAGNQNQPAPTVTLPGTYVISVTNSTNSCVTTDTVVVDENTLAPVANAGADNHLDCQTTIVTLDGLGSSSGQFITYNWQGPDITGANQNQQSPAVSVLGTYNLTVTDTDNGCTSTDVVTVTQDITAPVANAGTTPTITCANPSVTINGSGSSTGAIFQYGWQGPGINSNNFDQLSPVVADSGTYVLLVANTQNFCTSTATVYVDMDQQAPITAAGPDQTLTCATTSVTLDGSLSQSGANISFLWSGPGLTPGQETSVMPTATLPGNYNLTVTDALNGCTASDFAVVGENVTAPAAEAGSDLVITCANSAVGVTISSTGSSTGNGISYLWSGNGITPGNQNQANPTVLVPGPYTLVVTDAANGCTSSDVMTVDQDQNLPIPSAGPDQTINCSVLNVTLDATASTSQGGTLTYAWVGPGINTGNINSATPLVNQSGTYTVTVVNTLTGCQASDQVVVLLDNMPPNISVTSELITCQDPNATVAVTSSLPGSTYFWDGLGVTNANMDDPSINVTDPGLYSVTVTAPNGCSSIGTTEVMQDANVPDGIAEGAILNCYNGGSAEINGQVLTPAGSTFTWTGPGIGTQTTGIVTVTQAGNYNFNMTTPTGCKKTITVQVTANFAAPTVAAQPTDQLDCSTTEVSINAGGTSTGTNFVYVWTTTDGNIVSGDNGLNPLVDAAGDYQLLVTNVSNGCADSVTVAVTVDPAVPSGFDLAVRNIVCFGDVDGSITINGVNGGTAPFNFTLVSSNGTATNQYTGLSAGEYTLSLLDANGCELDTTIQIGEPGQLMINLGPNVEIELGDEAEVSLDISHTTPLKSITWNFIPEDAIEVDSVNGPPVYVSGFRYLPLNSYRHTVTVIDSNGCVQRDEVLVVVDKPRNIYIPNVFNPDSSDPDNSGVRIYMGRDVAKVQKWLIFDRWGNAVYEVQDVFPGDTQHAWTGKIRGQDGQLGVYVWYAVVEFIDGEVIEYKGDVTLAR